MDIEVKVIKGIPKEQINKFEDRVVYNTAVLTREYVKSQNGYPYKTGELRRSEVASPIMGSNKQYELLAGVKYAQRVYNMTNVSWTNPSTVPKWYYNTFRQKGKTIANGAVNSALKEI